MTSGANDATPILYVNMGGEMLYVLQQRLQTQKISADKTIQVMNEVIYALLNAKQLALIWATAGARPTGLAQLRPILERVVLSSIMKLDANSMDKLFDLMIMMVKYQLSTASGPRELLLSSLNHLDAVRDMALTDSSLGPHLDACHRLLVDTYGQMTHKQLWQIRDECLHELQQHNVRVSILLRLGLQNQDASFNRMEQAYKEDYQQRRPQLDDLPINQVVDENASMGVLGLFGDRATLLGKNAYCLASAGLLACPGTGQNFLNQALARSNKAMRQELQTLAAQLGKEETAPARPFSLQLHQRDDNPSCDSKRDNERRLPLGSTDDHDDNDDDDDNHNLTSTDQYKNHLIDDVNAQFADNDNCTRSDTADLMNLLDIM